MKILRPALCAAMCFGVAFSSTDAAASPPNSHSQRSILTGMYNVTAATDPVFPDADGREWFLDFGRGLSDGKTSGTVAVSLRQNPNVRVRILVWQYHPQTGHLKIGNQTGEGESRAVLLAEWKMTRGSSGLILQRGDYQAVLLAAGPLD